MSEAAQMPDSEENQTRILLIDDSKVMRKSAVKMLGSDFDVVVAEDGEQGLSMIQDDPSIHVVFTDLNMPKMNGYQLLEAIRTAEDEGIRGLPVIVVTGAENDDEAKEHALEQGATDFITKPFNSTDLKARAQAHANYQRTTKSLQEVAVVDALTGLANERSFRDVLAKDLSFVARHNHTIATMYVEVDQFNDLFLKIGRKGADSLVKQIAKVLLKNVRKEDTVARVGLARFAVSLPTAAQAGAVKLAERICATVAGFKASLKGESLQISVSVGVYVPAVVGGDLLPSLLEQTETSLKTALANGGNQVHCAADMEQDPYLPDLEPIETDVSIDNLLQSLASSGSEAVQSQIPGALLRLAPLLSALNSEQKQQLMSQLQQ